MNQEILDEFKAKFDEAEMIVIGIGGQLALNQFKDDNERITFINKFIKFLGNKNYFIITTHKNNIFDGTNVNPKRLCNPLIDTENTEKQWDFYNKWLAGSLNRKLLLIELGEDFNQPNVFRWPFEKIVFINQKSYFYRIHDLFYQLPEQIGDRANSITANSKDFLFELVDNIV